LLFSHIYTWLVSALVIFTFLSVMLKMNSYPKRNVTLLLLVVISSSAIVVTRTAMTEWSYDGGILGTGLYPVDAHQQIGLNQFTLRWDNLERTMHTFVSGQFSNFIILGLGLYSLYRSNWREPSTIFLMIFLSTGIFGFMFENWETQTRVFYDIPFQIPAGIGLAMILNKARRTVASPLLFFKCGTIRIKIMGPFILTTHIKMTETSLTSSWVNFTRGLHQRPHCSSIRTQSGAT
jgi:hypothetical protein